MLCCATVSGRRLVVPRMLLARRVEQTNQPGQRIAQHAEHEFQAQEAGRVFLCILFV